MNTRQYAQVDVPENKDCMPCGHHISLFVKSVESEYQFCELCECKSMKRDAESMENVYKARAKTAERQLAVTQAAIAATSKVIAEGAAKESQLERQLAELQEKTQRMIEPQNPCNCVPDGDDGTVAHLCHWHKTAFGKAYRMQNMANSLTIENIAKLPQDRLRLWIAHGIQESTARKRAEEQLAECQKECEEQARLNGMGSEREARLMAQLAELQAKYDGLVRAAENLRDGLPEQDPYASELVAALAEELAKLNGGKG